MKIYAIRFIQGGKPSFRAFASKERAEVELVKAKESIVKEDLEEWYQLEQNIQTLEINSPTELAQMLNDWNRYSLLRVRR